MLSLEKRQEKEEQYTPKEPKKHNVVDATRVRQQVADLRSVSYHDVPLEVLQVAYASDSPIRTTRSPPGRRERVPPLQPSSSSDDSTSSDEDDDEETNRVEVGSVETESQSSEEEGRGEEEEEE